MKMKMVFFVYITGLETVAAVNAWCREINLAPDWTT